MTSQNSVVLAVVVVSAGLFAALRGETPKVEHAARSELARAEVTDPGESETLPLDHPPIGGMKLDPGAMASEEDPAEAAEQTPSIAWKVPPKWLPGPKKSRMRLATYRVPAKGGAAEEAELSVVRAGGSTDANLERWVGQFADAAPARRGERIVHGLRVTTLELSGTFAGGGMGPGDPPATHPGWMLGGAVVETNAGAYFFKLTGPGATVREARADFDALVSSVAPVPPPATL